MLVKGFRQGKDLLNGASAVKRPYGKTVKTCAEVGVTAAAF